jgi:hypothetical protein
VSEVPKILVKVLCSAWSALLDSCDGIASRLTRLLIASCIAIGFSAMAGAQQPRFDWTTATELHAGVLWGKTTATLPRPLSINVLRIDTRAPGIRFLTTRAADDWIENERETIRQTTRDFLKCSRESGIPLVAAVNADAWKPFPAPETTPANLLGLSVSDGRLVSPGNGTPSLIVSRSGHVRFETTHANTDISDIHTAVSGFGFALIKGLPIESGPALHPRTGYGLCSQQRYLFWMTIDGRRFSSQGATVSEVGLWLAYFGAYDGLNMDGGGSTTLVWWNTDTAKAELLNLPNGLNLLRPEQSDQQQSLETLLLQQGILPNERHNGNNLGVYFETE